MGAAIALAGRFPFSIANGWFSGSSYVDIPPHCLSYLRSPGNAAVTFVCDKLKLMIKGMLRESNDAGYSKDKKVGDDGCESMVSDYLKI